MIRLVLSLVLVVTALAAGRPARADDAAPDPKCAVPPELVFDPPALSETAAALGRHEKLVIVTLGAGATEGRAAGDPTTTYPARLEAHLRDLLPGIDLSVINAGMARQDVAQMVARLDRDVISRHATLVIWDAGINDAARGADVDRFTEELSSGLDRLHASAVDTILIDMQYAPRTASIIDFDRYRDALARSADLHDLALFRRFDIMRAWSDSGVFDFDETDPAKRTQTARALYDCIAELLAQGIAKAVKP